MNCPSERCENDRREQMKWWARQWRAVCAERDQAWKENEELRRERDSLRERLAGNEADR